MTRDQLLDYVRNQYGIEPEFPWEKHPRYCVLRHQNAKRRWFAVLMTIPKSKLGLNSEEMVEVVNLKGEPVVIDNLRDGVQFFPAYHMNKTHWFSAILQENLDNAPLTTLLDWSFDLTK